MNLPLLMKLGAGLQDALKVVEQELALTPPAERAAVEARLTAALTRAVNAWKFEIATSGGDR